MFQSLVLLLLLWFELVQNQSWNGYSIGASLDPYSQSYGYGQQGYDYAQYLQLYMSPYTNPNMYDYQQYYNSYQEGSQKPIVIIINEDDRDESLDIVDLISLITSLKDKSNDGPVYVPYPVPVQCCDCDSNYDFDWDFDEYSDCSCRNKGSCKSSRKNERLYDDDDCSECRKRGRSKSKCRCSESHSHSERRCNKCDSIKHKNDCYYCRI